jgi:Flavin containing amine oxidoreductase
VPADGRAESGQENRSIVIVGGGIAGLYAAYLLGRLNYSVQVFESSDRWGGRIHSEVFEVEGGENFVAEFGPMRFEAHLQERLRRLCFHLGIDFESFSPTQAPIGTTHYDLTATEESFKSPADLLQWAVLKMFFEEKVASDLRQIEEEEKKKEDSARQRDQKHVNRSGPRQLALLKQHMDKELFCEVTGSGRKTAVVALDDEEIQTNLEDLRTDARLRGAPDGTRLAQLGLWNALSEVVSPGALARIRDGGTFYHFIADNPSAADWGIFWLRQASVMGGLFRLARDTAPKGTYSLVEALRERIEEECAENVDLHHSREVVDITYGKRSHEVQLRIVCHGGPDGSYTFSQTADDVVLALPRQPLLGLADHFPTDVRGQAESVTAMPLLKAFLVVEDPWWRHHLKAQSFAWLVPTRELHFFRPSLTDCDAANDEDGACTCDTQLSRPAKDLGMIMLYTDQPAITYWQALMAPEQRDATVWEEYADGRSPTSNVEDKPNGLLATLIRRLLMIPEPGLARRINLNEDEIIRRLSQDYPELTASIESAPGATLNLAEQIFNATGHDPKAQDNVKEILGQIDLDIEIDNSWHEWLGLALRYAPSAGNLSEGTKDLAGKVRAFGIRDWTAAPFGGASHVWLPTEEPPRRGERDRLIAFNLRGRAGGESDSNLHVCGEAYSDFQGFIEGALRTAEKVVDSIASRTGAVPSTGRDLGPKDKDAEWAARQSIELTENWQNLNKEL